MRARPNNNGIKEVRDGYRRLQSAAERIGSDSLAAVIALEEKAACIDTVSAHGIPSLLRKGPSPLELLRRGVDIRIIPEVAIDEERIRLLLAAGMIGLDGTNKLLRAVFNPAALTNSAEDRPLSALQSRSAATHILQLAAHPFLDADLRIIEPDIPSHHEYAEVTAYRHTRFSRAMGASGLTLDGQLNVFQSPEAIREIDDYITRQLTAANESRPVGPTAPDGLTNHLAYIAGIAQGE